MGQGCMGAAKTTEVIADTQTVTDRNGMLKDFEVNEKPFIELLDFLENILMEEQEKRKQAEFREYMDAKEEEAVVNFTFENLANEEGVIDVYAIYAKIKKLLGVTDEEGQRMLAEFDKDGDGKISQKEFDDWIISDHAKQFDWVEKYNKSQQFIEKYCEDAMKGHKPSPASRRPLCLVSYGPQGSGKTSSTKSYLKKIGADPVAVDIDDLTRKYAQDVLGDISLCETTEGYFKVRNGWPSIGKSALINKCRKARLDILLETTGRRMKTWEQRCKPLINSEEHYKVIVIYVLVPYIELIKRILKRHKKTGQAYEHFGALCEQVKNSALNSNKWFDKPDDGGFVYFNNNLGFNNQKQCETEKELQDLLLDLPFMKLVAETVKWRPVPPDDADKRLPEASPATPDFGGSVVACRR